ncbi:zinc-binding dehydrogenase [Mobiluncus mulieris]|uniref:Zinc-binding dehydrogenase n=1 Tax=Mobiluncus mulieris TaxID=2052 RepID=A0ABD4TSQ6_9ACTO|nr:zinc-binding dehydrogenase [Mobiluncus mulieris]MCU9967944.1 zinc-binding dehydrogenase [Mobiluncus mulieris]MCU9973336.1 zinc-binding dehydrogenase [Mobiluncus mulieris]MCU9974986.1 zinc-binding dehydrogenase [Mobiluncus mulieris]NMX01293.1 zinc-binding dehydrogenase [Mobiluncus mulieris]NMX10633.1 zinc-binding dehydrogenase [Mobiluncus mulieris]
MKAAVLRDPQEGLRVETIKTPRPRSREVLVKVAACGMCHSDLHVIHGKIAFPYPCVLGHEVTGEIVELGPDNDHTGLKVGQKVSGAFLMPCGQCSHCAEGRDDLCDTFFNLNRLQGKLYDGQTRLFGTNGEEIAMYSMGALAQYCVIPSTSVAVLPDDIDLVPGAILGCAAMTAYGAVRRGADLRFGETVAVVATGGVGSNIIQISKAFGASQIIAVDVADDKLEAAKRLGATNVVNSTKEDVHEAVFKLTGGKGVDVAFEALGRPETWESALNALSDGGRMVPIGLGAGVQTAGVEINRTVRRGQSILGSYGARTRVDLPKVIEMAAKGYIDYSQIVTRRFSLEDAGKGYDELAAGKIQGRAVVDMSL